MTRKKSTKTRSRRKSPARNKRKRRTPNTSRFRPGRRTLGWFVIASILVTALYVIWLDYRVVDRFTGRLWSVPARVYANEGIAQVVFLESDELCERSYADKKGKYQRQIGVTPPRVSES